MINEDKLNELDIRKNKVIQEYGFGLDKPFVVAHMLICVEKFAQKYNVKVKDVQLIPDTKARRVNFCIEIPKTEEELNKEIERIEAISKFERDERATYERLKEKYGD